MIKNSILTLAVLSLSFNALAEDWTNWRGPNYKEDPSRVGRPPANLTPPRRVGSGPQRCAEVPFVRFLWGDESKGSHFGLV